MVPRPFILLALAGLVGVALIGTRRTDPNPASSPESAPEPPPTAEPATPRAAVTAGRRGGLDVICGSLPGRVATGASHGVPAATRGPDGRPLPPPRPAPFPKLRTPHPVVEESRRINQRETPPREDLQIVQAVLEAYGRALGAHPAGDNGDILAALAGRNPLGLVFVPPDHPAIDPDGRLLDRWGTPIFFDSVSRSETRLRSAGPDKTLWTGDDLVAD